MRAAPPRLAFMPELAPVSLLRRALACAVLVGGVALSGAAFAQTSPGAPPPPAPPPPAGAAGPSTAPAVNPICPRLEAQLATIDHGGSGDPAKAEQIRRYRDAAARQQSELYRVTAQAKRMGCDSSGFFSL